jgi:LCP family protein required for cell wall assembly
MSDNAMPTQVHNEPVRSEDGNQTVRHQPPAELPVGGQWSGFPQPEPVRSPLPPVYRRHNGHRQHVARRRPAGRRSTDSPGDWAWVLVAAGLLGVTAVVSAVLFFVVQATRGEKNSSYTDQASIIEPTSVLYGPGGILENTVEAPAGGLLEDGQSMIIHPWDGKERFTILLMGMDQRPGESGPGVRTDTMILLSLDPNTKRVGMLSIPRDLYVDVPGYGLQRVNTAYQLGELQTPGNGPRLVMQTIQYNLGIPVNDYAIVDFNTFITVIDLIDGIDVNVSQAIYDPQYPDMYYGYDPFYLEAGMQHLDGKTALKYARSRHGSDDINRASRQQQVLYAVRDKVISSDMISTLALEAPVLWSELNAGISTGLALDQILELAWYLKDIPSENFTNDVLGWQYVIPTNWQGMDILVPDRAKIGSLMIQVFGPDYATIN